MSFVNESRGVAPNLVTVQYVKATEAIHGLSREPMEWNHDEVPMKLPGNAPPSRARRNGRDHGNVPFLRVKRGSRDQPFFERTGKLQCGVRPDIGNRARWEEE